MVAGNLQVIFRGSIRYSWSLTFYGLAGVFLALWLWHSQMLPHARNDRQRPIVSARAILSGFVLTFRTFLRKEGIIRALCFIMLFRLSEALLSKISPSSSLTHRITADWVLHLRNTASCRVQWA